MKAAGTEIVTAKRALRKAMKLILGGLDASTIARESACVTAQLVATDEWASATRIACFCSMPGGEFASRSLLEAAFAAKKRVFLPRVIDAKERTMEMLEAASLDDVDSFPASSWGIPEPPAGEDRPDALVEGVDLVVVPGVAFDFFENRLGHGAGFYDTWLRRLGRRPFKVGVALKTQVLPVLDREDLGHRIPCEAHDLKLDLVLRPIDLVSRGLAP